MDRHFLSEAMFQSVTSKLDDSFYPGQVYNWDDVRFANVVRDHLRSDHVLLDFGAGRGKSELFDFRGAVQRIVGVDVDENVRLNPYLDECHVLRHGESVPLADDSVDIAYCCNVLEHVQDPKQTLREIARVLKPGGLFLAKTPNRLHYATVAARCTPFWFHRWFNRKRGRVEHDTFPTVYRCNSKRQLLQSVAESDLQLQSLYFWEGRPEYTRVFPLMYAFGIAYERLVNSTALLAPYRAVLVATLEKKI